MFLNRSLVYKQVFFFLLMAFSLIFILGTYFYFYSRDAIINRTYDQLTSIRETKKNQIEYFFNERINNARYLAQSSTAKLIYNDINENHNINGERLKKEIGFEYYGFLNIYFVTQKSSDSELKIMSLVEENSSILNGKPSKPMMDLWAKVSHGENFAMSDYIKRFESDSTPVIWIGIPFNSDIKKDVDSKMIVFEISSTSITNTLLKYSAEKGFGYSGEAYLVGDDFKLRSDSRFIKNAILNTEVKSEAAVKALSGEQGKMITRDYRNVEVYSSYAPINIFGHKWAILSEIDYLEAMKSIIAMRNDIIFLTIIIFLFIISISFFLALTIVNPIRKLEKAALKIGQGEFDVQLEIKSKDEIGSLTRSFNQMANRLSTITSELIEREQRLNHFYEATLEGILIHDNGKPILMNQALINITGFDEPELTAMQISEWINHYSVNDSFFETTLIHKNGKRIEVEIQNNTLQFNNSTVNVTIVRDITLRKQTEKALIEERKERLSALFNGQEIERQRISRELHDGLGQKMAGIKLKLENIPNIVDEKTQTLINSIKQNLTSSIDELRRISYDLRPPVLTELGLVSTLENLCKEFESDSHCHCEFSCFGSFSQIPIKTSTYFYRICQEGLTNIARHAEAKNVHLQLIENKIHYIIIIEDDGKGFHYSKEKRICGNGLFNMNERVMLLNGIITIESQIGNGTTVRVKVPKVMD